MFSPKFRALALVLVLGSVAFATGGSKGGWWGNLLDEEKTTPLEKIIANPNAYLGLRVAFVAQFHRLGTVQNPFYTRFDKEWYLNFSVWPDGAKLWDKKAYRGDYPYLFIKRNKKDAALLASAGLYSRWMVVGEVSDIFKGRPWIEVKSVKRLDEEMNEASLISIVKGNTLRGVHRYAAAASEFRNANTKKLPKGIRIKLIQDEASCLELSGQLSQALARVQDAKKISPDDKTVAAWVADFSKKARAKAEPQPADEKKAIVKTEKIDEKKKGDANPPAGNGEAGN